jgi:hypothetical protein
MFRLVSGANIACAGCHPEAGDDGQVWSFRDIGPRRTQLSRGGILGTEPLHWNGDMADFGTVIEEVFVGRMQGFDVRATNARTTCGSGAMCRVVSR